MGPLQFPGCRGNSRNQFHVRWFEKNTCFRVATGTATPLVFYLLAEFSWSEGNRDMALKQLDFAIQRDRKNQRFIEKRTRLEKAGL